jgi:hypothetical protein
LPALPFRVFGFAAQPWAFPLQVVLLGLAARSEFLIR